MSAEVIKNPNRNRPRQVPNNQSEHERYGIIPKQYNSSMYAGNTTASLLGATTSPPKRGGNIMNETVAEVDGVGVGFGEQDIPTRQANPKSHIIDNNEFMTYDYLADREMEEAVENGGTIDLDKGKEKSSLPNVGEYILMVSNKIILSGPLKVIEEKIQGILYGEDIDFESDEISQEDIVVLKRVEIKAGVFIKE